MKRKYETDLLIDKKFLPDYIKKIKQMLYTPLKASRSTLLPMVKLILKKRNKFLKLAKKYPTPFYIIDQNQLESDIRSFKLAFSRYMPGCEYYYAMKINHHPQIIKTVIANGYYIDVSSSNEMIKALRLGAKKVIFSGPGKTDEELKQAVLKNKIVTVMIDNFSELERLAEISQKFNKNIITGIRIHTQAFGEWSKFGIRLGELKKFWQKAKKYPRVNLRGIQFHMSWHEDARPYQESIKELAGYLKSNFNKEELLHIKFIDFGGGFRPRFAEGYFPYHTPQGIIIKEIDKFFNQPSKFKDKYFISEAASVNDYAKGIAEAIDRYLKPLVNCRYFTEPGRIISNNAMHIILKVVDIKEQGRVVVDGGINMVGWEKYKSDYIPLINLTHPASKEIKCIFYGSLCLPDDLWGYYFYGSKVKAGDIILVPRQGCTTYSLAQNFIKPIPRVHILK